MPVSEKYYRSDYLMTNYIVVPTYNCFDKLLRCLESCLKQSIETHTWILNNGSNMSQLREFMYQADKLKPNWSITSHYPNFQSISAAWNYALTHLFHNFHMQRVLVINNDVQLQPETYERLLRHAESHNKSFVTGISVDDPNPQMGDDVESPHPDFSCFLISRECFRAVGEFDIHFAPAYREDQDYHWRMRNADIEAVKINVPFFHDRSSTTRDNPEMAELVAQWDQFRKDYYIEKWGALWPSEKYRIPFDGREHSCKYCPAKTQTFK